MTIHAFGNMWMFPWGNTLDHAGDMCERSDDFDDLVSTEVQAYFHVL